MTAERIEEVQRELTPMLQSYAEDAPTTMVSGFYSIDPSDHFLRVVFPDKFCPGSLLRRLAAYCAENGLHMSAAAPDEFYLSIA